ncbi:hypothetical protein [Dyadobacter psychrotolerans]|uniref:Uncharacterized protein n=1 Tax=Dyadobacter psychrotolerans TaxID=2541721 RepID=A0A4R5DYV4_9BACT|nr:hypothetical protein [Dyadobacter psychrotolerans]TDE17341.1 hypothetical protein E0F88_05480 [Dyadobacter psychrotolerans]
MKIILTKSGGLIGKPQRAEIDLDLTPEQWRKMKDLLKKKKPSKTVADGFNQYVEAEGEDDTTLIDPVNLPVSFKEHYAELEKKLDYLK